MAQIGKNIQSVQRAIDILDCFQSKEMALSLGEISVQLGLNKSTAHGIINTLRNNNYLRQASDGKYLIGSGLSTRFEFSRQSYQAIILNFLEPHMITLANKYAASTKLFNLSQHVPSLIHKISPPTIKYELSSDFATDPLYCSATGKLILSEMSPTYLDIYLEKHPLVPVTPFTIVDKLELKAQLVQIKENRLSIENQELGESISAIAAPIYCEGSLVASISITDTTSRMMDYIEELSKDLKLLGRLCTEKLDEML